MTELASLGTLALEAARAAAALCARGYRTRPSAAEKRHKDLVTEFDLRSESLLLERLTPTGYGVVAEEGARLDRDCERIWYVDPLDGTTNFVHGHPFWCVAVGLFDTHAREPLCGAVVAPALALEWHGWHSADDRRALRNGDPCQVSDTTALDAALIATGFPPERERAPDNNFDAFVRVKRAARAVRRCGSAAIDLCLVADGTYDGYWERRLSPWDTVAGSAIALAAGARITALAGGAPDYATGHLVVSNGRIHGALVHAVAEPAAV